MISDTKLVCIRICDNISESTEYKFFVDLEPYDSKFGCLGAYVWLPNMLVKILILNYKISNLDFVSWLAIQSGSVKLVPIKINLTFSHGLKLSHGFKDPIKFEFYNSARSRY